MSAFGGARGVGAKPPEKGIFPLDHFGECKQVKQFRSVWCQHLLAVLSGLKFLAAVLILCRLLMHTSPA
jgi:cytochrome c oxidase assembly protein subunit 19